MSNRIEVRPWFSDREPLDDVLGLMRQSHHRDISRDWLSIKLSWGLGGVGALAYDQGKPVGLVLFGAAPYEYQGDHVDVMLSYDTFVDARYRGQGLFTRLLRTAEDACRSVGVALLLNFPNDASRPGFARAGWLSLPPMRSFVNLNGQGALRALTSRIKAVMNSRNEPFVPVSTGPLEATLIESLSAFRPTDGGLQFSLSSAGLRYRFDPLRGNGYDGLLTGDSGAIFRSGTRGEARELQLMTTFPRRMVPRQSRRLLHGLRERYAPDLISDLRSEPSGNPLHLMRDGFIGLTLVTTPYFKTLNGEIELQAPALNGIDIHTW